MALVLVVAPAIAIAKPKVAVAPIDGDKGGRVADAVVDITNADAGPDKVSSALETMGSDNVNSKVAKKLRTKLKADVVVHGKVAKSGKSKHLTLWLAGKSKTGTVEIDFKTANSKSFKKELREEIEKQLESVSKEGDEGVASEEKPKHKHKKKMHKDEGGEGSAVAEDEPKHKKKHKKKDETVASEDPPAGEEGEVKVKKKKHSDEEEAPFERTAMIQPDLSLVVGMTALHHSLNYVSNGMTGQPPRVSTTAPALEVYAEYFPKQLAKPNGSGWGFDVSVRQVVGLKIAVPGSTETAPITEATYTLGAKYRLSLGKLNASAGLEWWRQRFIANRSGIDMPLDMVDSDYTAVAPVISARYPVYPKTVAFASFGLPYAFAGATTFGDTSGLGFDFIGGADYQLGKHYAVRFDLTINKLTAKYKDQDPASSMAAGRGISALGDTSIGFAATFALLY